MSRKVKVLSVTFFASSSSSPVRLMKLPTRACLPSGESATARNEPSLASTAPQAAASRVSFVGAIF